MKRFLTRGLAFALTFVMLASTCFVAHAENSEETAGFYRTSGRQILDGQGNEVVLKGISFGNMTYGNPASVDLDGTGNGVRNDHDAESYKELAAMGFDHVRFEISYGLFEDDSNPGTYKQSGFDWLNENIAAAKAAGIKLIIQMKHPQGGYQSSTSIMSGSDSGGKALWIDLDEDGNVLSTEDYKQNQERLIALWTEIASRYKDEPTIIGYGLLNEPTVPQKDTAEETVGQWKDLAQRIADGIRSVDNNHMLFVECLCSWFKPGDYNGTDWNQVSLEQSQFTISDSNTVYEFHFYDPLSYTHQGADWLESSYSASTYPSNTVIEYDILDWNSKGSSTVQTAEVEGDWTYFESAPFQATSTYNYAMVQVCAAGIPANGSVWVDDVVVTRIDSSGASTTLFSYDFAQDTEGFYKTWPESLTIEHDTSTGKTAAGALKITNTDSGSSNQWANAQSWDMFYLEDDCTYKISGWVKNGDSSQQYPQASFYYANSVQLLDKDYLAYRLNKYLVFGQTNNVPLHVGEWGFHYNCYALGAAAYTEDLTDLFEENGLSSNYHSYHDSTFGLYLSEEYAQRPERNDTLYELLTTHYVTPVTHTHDWDTAWAKNGTHHWHECTATGCTVTDDAQKDGYGAHSWGSWTVTKAATESEVGSQKHSCTVCGYEETEEIPILGHVHSLTKVDGQAATCETDGWKDYYSCTCGKYFSDTQGTVEITDLAGWKTGDGKLAAGHEGSWEQTITPTCTEKGEEQRICTHCGTVETREVNATGHTPGEWETVTPASEGKTGLAHKVCTECGAEVETKTLPALSSASSGGGAVVDPDPPVVDPTPVEWENPFTDIKEEDWFYSSVKFVCENGLMEGTSETGFSPNQPMTRGMLATVLYRMEEEPSVTVAAFSDVSSGLWYSDAIAWAAENGVVNGVGNNRFAPDLNVTREQLVTMLYRYAQLSGTPKATGDLSAFDDGNEVSSYAREAMSWAVSEGIVFGKGGGVLDPKGNATRAEVAAILERYCRMK